MKNLLLPLLLLALAATHAAAQVTVNPAALDPPAKPAPRPASPPPARPSTGRPAASTQARPAAQPVMPDVPLGPPPAASIRPIPPPPSSPALPNMPDVAATAPAEASPPDTTSPDTTSSVVPAMAASPDLPAVPQRAPPPPVIPPPLAVAARPAAPPGGIAITADAPGAANPMPGGLRVTFGPGRSDMTAATSDAVRALARASGKIPSYSVTGLAAGSGDDPSAARRLSLARGLAIRALLINEGVASTRIYVRALGNNAEAIGAAAPDRADIVVGLPEPARSAP